jgi:hypothetical protein
VGERIPFEPAPTTEKQTLKPNAIGFVGGLVIGYGFMIVGVVLVLLWRVFGHEPFFRRKAFEAVDPEVAAGKVAVAETVGLEP